MTPESEIRELGDPECMPVRLHDDCLPVWDCDGGSLRTQVSGEPVASAVIVLEWRTVRDIRVRDQHSTRGLDANYWSTSRRD